MNNTITLRDGKTHGRIILGGWQLSEWHSTRQNYQETLKSYVENGIDAIDCADIYTGVEQAIWIALSANKTSWKVRVHTKHVPDLDAIKNRTITEQETRTLIERSISRIQKPFLDLVQFHQWDYSVDTYKISIRTLQALQHEWKIHTIGVTNSSVEFIQALERECNFIPITSQNQYNIIDRRAMRYLVPYCKEKRIGIYAYGSLMGGFLSEKYLWKPKPTEPLENRSLRKYLRIIDDWGDWDLFQELLSLLRSIWTVHNASISEVAMNWTLSRDWVSAIIVWARDPQYASTLNHTFSFDLTDIELNLIDILYRRWREIEWDVFDLERYVPRHRDIMKMNLNDKDHSS